MKRVFVWLVFFYLALFPFGQLTRLPVSLAQLPEVNLYLTDVVVGAASLFWVLTFFSQKRQLPPFFKEVSGFFGIATFSLLLAITQFNNREIFVASLYLLRWISYAIFFFATWGEIKRKRIDRRLLGNSLLLVGFLFAVFSWIGYFAYPDLRPLVEFGWDEHYLRIVGTFLDPGFAAIILVFFLLIVFERLLARPRRFSWERAFVFLGFLVGFFALAFTYSRSGYLALLAGVFLLSWQRRVLQVFLGVTLLLLATIFLLPRPESEGAKLERTATALARVENWQETLEVAAKSPLFGVGFNTLRYARQREGLVVESTGYPSHSAAGSDSSLVLVLATTGVVGFLSYLSLWTRIALRAKTVLPTIAAVFVHSLFLNSLFYPWVLGWLALLFSLEDFKE